MNYVRRPTVFVEVKGYSRRNDSPLQLILHLCSKVIASFWTKYKRNNTSSQTKSKTFGVMRREGNAKLLKRNTCIFHDSPWGASLASLAMRPSNLHGQKNGVHKYHNNACETYSIIGSVQVGMLSGNKPRLGIFWNLKCTQFPLHLPRGHWFTSGP